MCMQRSVSYTCDTCRDKTSEQLRDEEEPKGARAAVDVGLSFWILQARLRQMFRVDVLLAGGRDTHTPSHDVGVNASLWKH